MKFLKIPENQIYNAYLLTGEDREALEQAAQEFAASLLIRDHKLTDSSTAKAANDSDPYTFADPDPIWQSRGYQSIEDWKDSVRLRVEKQIHPDLIRISPDKPEDHPNTISVDNIRRNVTDTVDVRPYEAEYKIYLVLQAEKMNPQAQNALLKTLEEPPAYVVIMLLASNADHFLPTILSRVIEIKAGEKDAGESFRTYYQEDWAKETVKFLSEIRYRSIADILQYIDSMNKSKVPMADLLALLEIVFRDVLCYKGSGDSSLMYAGEISDSIIKLAGELSFEELGRVTDEISRDLRGIRSNVNRDLQLETLLLLLKKVSGDKQ
jgi:DNA polymerase-3 subunit delta'